jgi:pimeloyl-ACP methyl ester carboxylesterase
MQVIVNRLLINYELEGKGKLVLLLHGWGDSVKGVSSLKKVLSSEYQVLAVDLPGLGASQAPNIAWDLDNYSDFLEAFLKKLNLDQPYAVIGHSNGGALAIRAISLNRLKPKKLVLMAASGIRAKASAKRTSFMFIAKTGKVASAFLPPSSRKRLRDKLYASAGSDMLVIPHMQETFKKIVRQDVQTDAAKIAIPTLLIYGQNDQETPLSFGKIYNQQIKGSKLEVVASAGHFVHIDQSKITIDLIEDFLK